MSASDKLDLILFGATGFTGKFCIEHLLEKYCGDDTFKFGLAARNIDKLKTLVSSFSTENKNTDQFELIECDSLNPQQVKDMVLRTNVIITTVGPYSIYGENLITICAKNGVDYIDLTGELHWVKQMIDKCEQYAIKSKARIVNTAGCMSAIPDCVVYACIKRLTDDEKKSDTNYSIRTMLQPPSGAGESGGSAQTTLTAYKQDALKHFNDQKLSYQLCPSENKYSNIQPRRNNILPQWNAQLQRYEVVFFAAATIERQTICRSNHLLNYCYGTAPVINEQAFLVKSRSYIIGLFISLFSLILGFVVVHLTFLKPLIVKVMEYMFPTSGEGPYCDGRDREKMLSVVWKQYVFVEDKKSKKGVKAEVKVFGDYGYYNTAKLLVEQGIIYAAQRNFGEKVTSGGFLTPAAAFGKDEQLIKRLNKLKQFDIQFERY